MGRIRRIKARKHRRREGTIVKVGRRFRVQVSGGIDPATRKRVRLSGYEATEEDAERLRKKFRDQVDAGDVKGSFDPLLVDHLRTWAEEVKDSENTHHYRLDKIRHISRHLGAKRLHALTRADVNWLINDALYKEPRDSGGKPLSPGSRKLVRDVLHTALEHATRDATIRLPANVAADLPVKGYRDDFDPYVLGDREYEAFLDAAQSEDSQRVRLRALKGLPTIQMY